MTDTNFQYSQLKTIKNLSRDLSEERIKFMDNVPLSDISIRIEDGKTVRKIRRIMEKRVCQNYWKSRSGSSRSNFSRSSTKHWLTNQFKNIYDYVPEGFHYCA